MNTSKHRFTSKHILRAAVIVLAVTFAAAAPAALSAESLHITATTAAAVAKTAAASDIALRSEIKARYNELLTLQKQDQAWDTAIKAAHSANGQSLSALHKQIQQIDAAKLAVLDTAVKQARTRYKPLFSMYTALNKQKAAARGLKDKQLNSMLNAQADTMKIAVQFARQDIRLKDAALHAAKAGTAKTKSKLTSILAGIDPVKKQMTKEKKASAACKKKITTAGKALSQAVKKRDGKRAAGTLTELVSLMRQMTAHKQKTAALEKTITGIIFKAKAQLPSQ